MSDALPREIRCVLVPVGNVRLLLPNSTIAEVITQTRVEPMLNAPPWLLGRIAWRGWRVPLVSFTQLAGLPEADAELSVRVAVLKTLGGDPRLPFVAVVTQGFPRLTVLNAELIIPTHDGKPLPSGVRAQVLVRDDVAVIPDIEWIEAAVLELLAAAGLGATPAADGTDTTHAEGAPDAGADHAGGARAPGYGADVPGWDATGV
ncbi:MAG TPA: chemotaxis protein CheW [Rhodanobacter sp.]|jgi:chemosensory pili system protein ChpC